jgi:hypothetical protein
LELFIARHEVGLAIHLDQYADFVPGMDIGADHAFIGDPPDFFACGGQPFLTQPVDGFGNVVGILD